MLQWKRLSTWCKLNTTGGVCSLQIRELKAEAGGDSEDKDEKLWSET